jgi:hypothetical protein
LQGSSTEVRKGKRGDDNRVEIFFDQDIREKLFEDARIESKSLFRDDFDFVSVWMIRIDEQIELLRDNAARDFQDRGFHFLDK